MPKAEKLLAMREQVPVLPTSQSPRWYPGDGCFINVIFKLLPSWLPHLPKLSCFCWGLFKKKREGRKRKHTEDHVIKLLK